jgi:hypothetical protein
MRKASIIPVFLVLSACGGGGGSTLNPEFVNLRNQGFALVQQYGASGQNLTATANMPDSGTATYSGVAAYRQNTTVPSEIFQNPLTVSEISLTAIFGGTPTISGSLSNFQSSDPSVSFTGSLDLDGTISNNGFTVSINASSNEITQIQNGSSSTGTYTGILNGTFAGTNAEVVFGSGQMSGDFGGGQIVDTNMAFIAD